MVRIFMNVLFFFIGFAVCAAWITHQEQLAASLEERGGWSFLLFHLGGLFLPAAVCIAVEIFIRRFDPPRAAPNRWNNPFASYWIGFIVSALIFSLK